MSIIDDLVQVARRAQNAPKMLHVARPVEATDKREPAVSMGPCEKHFFTGGAKCPHCEEEANSKQ